MLSRAFDHICMEKARYKFLIIIIIIIIIIKCKHVLINFSWIIQKRRERSRKSRNAWKQFYYATLNKMFLCSILQL